MAERVGFVPVVPAPINDLGLIESPQSTKSTQNLSIRYKTGTAQSQRSFAVERSYAVESYEPRRALLRPRRLHAGRLQGKGGSTNRGLGF
jgi:hypothetical protein